MEKSKLKILLVASEVNPFSQTGGLGEVASSLPIAVNEMGKVEITVISPMYSCIPKEHRDKFEFVAKTYVELSWRTQYTGIFRYFYRGVTYYFIDNEYYFKRNGLYGHFDDGERFAYFSKAALDILPVIGYRPDIIHANDWHTALVPVYYRLAYERKLFYRGIKTVFTIHNIEYQGKFGFEIVGDIFGLSDRTHQTFEYGGCVNLVAAAIRCADLVSTVSETYAKELTQAEFACGLEYLIRENTGKMKGIVNGIDTVYYDPGTGADLFAGYSSSDLGGKLLNKRGIQKELKLPLSDAPMITMVTRLAAHKGLDILKDSMQTLVKEDIQFVLLGNGAPEYEGFFSSLERAFPSKVRAVIAFNKKLSRQLFAAGDIYMMPSRSEPCGLGQMMAMRYGTLPVVRNVGGLNDTVKDGINGFVIPEHTAAALIETTKRALEAYGDKKKWNETVLTAMTTDWSWKVSADKYVGMYEELAGK